MNKTNAARSRTRQFLVQALYQAQMLDVGFAEVIIPFMNDHNMKRADLTYFKEALHGINADQEALISLIEGAAEKTYQALDPVERGILLLGAYELKHRIDVPYRVVINESIELAQSFGATDSYRFVNSVLDSLSTDLRAIEQHDNQRI